MATQKMTYEIGFIGNTDRLKASIKEIEASLSTIYNKQQSPLLFDKTLDQAITSAKELEMHIQNAFNPKTGELDLTKLNRTLQASGKTIKDYGMQLAAIGPEGSKAFTQVANAVLQAEAPIRRVNGIVNELWITMKNTMRWQVTSGALMAFTGALETAYGYSKDLNKSLNSIRIVSDKSADDMARFAKEANKAARALSSTTLDYTDASLIYYQQGLDDQQVKDRTDITIKMANVANESAEIVSDQLTAVWNNFYNGTQTLEHYADAMVALGAATASSSDEIAGGLERFSSIADMIGLSFDYAASALATITATTRQSEDVVGTALRTIFARIQGLKLGETLDDDTDLNKYSTALQAVGISIFNTNGELKDMDNILDELGDKWKTLSKAQQVALAQTVAGVRQYNQLVSLMDNWDYFKENLAVAQNSDGELNRQAEIYAESWEAARNRVRAAAEELYSSLINDDAFIKITNGIGKIIEAVSTLTQGIGGLSTILPGVILLFNKLFGTRMVGSLQEIREVFWYNSKKAEESRADIRKQITDTTATLTQSSDSKANALALQYRKEQIELESQISNKTKDLNDNQLVGLQIQKEELKIAQDRTVELAEQYDLAKQEASELRLINNTYNEKVGKKIDYTADSSFFADKYYLNEKGEFDWTKTKTYQKLGKGYELPPIVNNKGREQLLNIYTAQTKETLDIRNTIVALEELQKKTQLKGSNATKYRKEIDNIFQSNNLKRSDYTKGTNTYSYDKLIAALMDDENYSAIGEEITAIGEILSKNFGISKEMIDKNQDAMIKMVESGKKLEAQEEANAKANKKLRDNINLTSDKFTMYSRQIVGCVNALLQFGMAYSALTNLKDIWNNDSISDAEKFTQTFFSLSMVLGSLVMIFKGGSTGKFISSLLDHLKSFDKINLSNIIKSAHLASDAFGALTKTILKFAVPIGITVTAFLTLKKVLDALGVTQKGAQEKIQKATEAYNEQKKVLDDLNSQLETTKNRIEELSNQDTLTLVEQEELEKLKLQNNLLERQKEIQEQAEKKSEKEKNIATLQYFPTAYKKQINNSPLLFYNGKTYTNWNDYAKAVKSSSDNAEEILEIAYKNWTDQLSNYAIKYKDDLVQAEQEATDIMFSVIANPEEYQQYQQQIQDMLNTLAEMRHNAYSDEDYTRNFIQPLFTNNNLSDEINTIIKQISQGIDLSVIENGIPLALQIALGKMGVSTTEFLSFVSKNIESKKEQILKLKGTTEEQIDELTAEDWEIILTLNLDNLQDFNDLQQKIEDNPIKAFDQSQIDDIKDLFNQMKDEKSILQSTYDQYNENGGYLTAEQAYALVEDNPSYTEYLIDNNNGTFSFNKSGEARIKALEYGEQQYMSSLLEMKDNYANATLETTNQAIDEVQQIKEDINNFTEEQKNKSKSNFNAENLKFYLENNSDARDELNRQGVNASDLSDISKTAQDTLGVNEVTSLDTDVLNNKKDLILKFIDSIKTLNSSLIDGKINITDYFTNLNSQIRSADFGILQDKTIESTEQVKKLAKFIGTLSNSINALLEQSLTDFQTGKINAAEYYHQQTAGLEAQLNLLKKINPYIIEEDPKTKKKTYKYAATKEEINAKDLDEAKNYENKIKDIEATKNQAEMVGKLADMYQKLAKNTDALYKNKNVVDFKLLPEDEVKHQKKVYQDTLQELYNSGEEGKAIVEDVLKDTGVKIENGQINLENTSDETMNKIGSNTRGKIADTLGIVTQKIQSAIEFLQKWIEAKQITLTISFGFDKGKLTADIQTAIQDAVDEQGNVIYDNSSLANDLAQLTADLSSEGAWHNSSSGKVTPATVIDTGKGSGSGSDDTPDHKDKKEFDDKYRDINNELERTTQLLDAIEKKEDKAFGRDKLKYYAEQIDQLNNKYSNYNELAYQANVYRQRGIENLKSVGIDLKVQDNGVADDELEYWQHKILDDYNAVVTKYNSLKSRSAQEAMQDEMDAAEKLYNKRKAYLDEFDSDTKQFYEAQQNKIDTLAEIWEVKLKQVKNEVDTLLDIQEFNKVTREIGKKIIESYNDVITQMSDANQTFFKDTAGMTLDELNGASYKEVTNIIKNIRTEYSQLQNMLAEKQQWDGIKNTKELAEAIKEAQNNLNSSLGIILEYEDYMENKLSNAVDTARERFNAFINQLDHNDTVLNSIKDLMTLQGETYKTQKGFSDLQNVASSRMNTALTNAKLQQQVNEKAKQALEEAQRNLDGTYKETDPAYDMLKKNRDALLEEYNQTQKDLLTAAKNAMDAAEEMYTNAIERASYKFEQAITSGMGFDLLQEKYDNLIEKEERYFDKVNERYNADAYYNKVQKAIDETTDTVAADRLKRLQTELDVRKRNNQLNQYDLDILEAKYNLTIAQNALEEAQNAKDSVRLVRNSAGNWDYQFTANQDDIDAAQDDYNKALNDWYNIAKDQTKDIMDEILKLKQDTHDQLEEIYKDDTLNEQEKNAKIEELRKTSLDKLEYLQREYNIAMDDMNEAGKLTITDYSNTYQGNIDLIDESTKNFEEAFKTACDEMEKAFGDYNSTLKDLAEDTGTDLSNLRTMLDEVADSTKKVGDAGQIMSNQVWDSISSILAQSDAFKELLVEIQRIKAEIGKDAQDMSDTYNNQSGARKDLGGFDLADMGVYAVARGYTDFARDIASARAYKLNDGTTADEILNKWLAEKASGQLKQSNLSEGKFSELYVQLKDLMGFSTGGYTENGGVAILHDKELVLNQDDTANMLSAIKILDSLAPNLAKILDNRANVGASMMATKATISSSVSTLTNKDTVPVIQQVQIQADFPGVTSALEIEMALNNIINDATQYTE